MEADPTKFSTTEQFLEAVEGENSLPEFAKQRSESILKQLSGELVVEASTSSQGNMGMPIPSENGEMDWMPDDFDPSQLPEDFDPSKSPPFNREGEGPKMDKMENKCNLLMEMEPQWECLVRIVKSRITSLLLIKIQCLQPLHA